MQEAAIIYLLELLHQIFQSWINWPFDIEYVRYILEELKTTFNIEMEEHKYQRVYWGPTAENEGGHFG